MRITVASTVGLSLAVLASFLPSIGDETLHTSVPEGTVSPAVAREPSARERALRQEFEGAYPEAAPASTGLRTWSIVAEPSEVEVFDGHTLKVWAYNGQIPGPTLRIRLGQTVRVRFTNKLPQPTTIHWHGVRVPNAMDGVPGVTQLPVLPGETFVYEYTPKDAGTYWFHPHVRSAEQVERGLYGVLIVDDAEPLPYTQDVTWILDDWRVTKEGQIDPNFMTRSELTHDGRVGNILTINGRTDTELTVKPGERIRLRLLNSANGRVFVPYLLPLDALVIAVDGKYAAAPFRARRFELAPGNRLDFDITVDPELAGRVIPLRDRFKRKAKTLGTIRVLDVDPVDTPDFPSPANAMIPAWEETAEVPPRLEYKMNIRQGGTYGLEWTLNDRAYPHEATADVLYTGEWAKIRYTNLSGRIHPMHIHGMFFRLLSRDGRRIPETFWRDTVLTHANETVEIATVPLDDGMWMLHCHILEHAAAGMMTLVEVKPRKPRGQDTN